MDRALIPLGILLTNDVVTAAREGELVRFIDSVAPAPTPSRARLDLYGGGAFNAGYGTGRHQGTIPEILHELALDLGAPDPDAITISEYLPGQGVGPHIDRPEAGPVIIGLSLLGDCVLRLRDAAIYPPIDVVYPARSRLRLSDPIRSSPWTHEILPVASRRISIVFRRQRPTAAW